MNYRRWRFLQLLLLLLTLAGSLLLSSPAQAVTKNQAYVACTAYIAGPNMPANAENPKCIIIGSDHGTYGRWYCRYMIGASGPFACGDWGWDEPATTECTGKPDLHNVAVAGVGGGLTCSAGCSYAVDIGTMSAIGAGVNKRTWGGTWVATGDFCSAGTPDSQPHNPNQQTCVQLSGGFGECVKPDGTHCKTASSGKQLCWKPGEVGPRNTTDGTFAADRRPAPQTPTPPTLIENPTPGPTTQTTVNGATYNSGVWAGTGTGGTPGQPSTGVSGDGDGDGEPDGGDEGDEADVPGEGVGDLYEGDDKELGDVVADFTARVSESEIAGVAGDFFKADGLGGSCPTFNMNFMGRPITLNFYCLPEFAQIFGWVSWFVLAGFAWFAFRWAFL